MCKLERKNSTATGDGTVNLDHDLAMALEVPLADEPAVRDSVTDLLRELQAKRRRRRGRGLTIGLITLGVLGAGGVGTAFAAPIHFPWDTYSSDASATVRFASGDICETAFQVNAEYVGPAPYKEKAEAGAAGSRYLKTLDLGSLDYTRALKDRERKQREVEAIVGGNATSTLTPEQRRTTIEGGAVMDVAWAKVNAELKRQGFTAGVGLSGQARCLLPGQHE